ncbi:MAG: biotin transporter BioY [Ignavibacteria bacterium]|nr:biotin transporter BioY [Ignavibacteria bacterium]
MSVITKSENIISYIKDKVISHPLFGIASFSILMAIAAQITIPMKPVPTTLQSMIVVLSGAMLGSRKGFYAMIAYLGMGIAGLPVFAQSPELAPGIARLFGPTGGYLLAFPLAAWLTGFVIERKSDYLTSVLTFFGAHVVILGMGALYLDLFLAGGFDKTLELGVIIFSVSTVVKVFAASLILKSLRK